MRRAPMTAAEISGLLAGLLSGLSGGSARIQVDSAPFATLDAESRTLTVQIAPLFMGPSRRGPPVRRELPVGLWNGRSIPSELARLDWRLTVYDGTEELATVGRGTSALTGHVRVSPAGLWKLRKLL